MWGGGEGAQVWFQKQGLEVGEYHAQVRSLYPKQKFSRFSLSQTIGRFHFTQPRNANR